MSLVDLKQSKKDAEETHCVEPSDAPRYPYGLTISLDDRSLKKLGMTSLPKVGTEMRITGIGVIGSASENSRQSGTHRNVSIQLQKLDVKPAKKASMLDAVDDAIEKA